jgi:uncharacterized protein YmfQ (DUF2313 family)
MALADLYASALAELLPQGYAWPRDAGSTLMGVVQGLASALAELDDVATQTAQEWQPHLTHTRMDDWEAATSLPDQCFGADQTLEQRRTRVLARLRGVSLAYTNSSPAAPDAIAGLCATLGLPVTVSYNIPFRVHRNRCGQRLGARDGRLWINVSSSAGSPFRVGSGRCGQRLIERPASITQMACMLDHYVPARFAINFNYV